MSKSHVFKHFVRFDDKEILNKLEKEQDDNWFKFLVCVAKGRANQDEFESLRAKTTFQRDDNLKNTLKKLDKIFKKFVFRGLSKLMNNRLVCYDTGKSDEQEVVEVEEHFDIVEITKRLLNEIEEEDKVKVYYQTTQNHTNQLVVYHI